MMRGSDLRAAEMVIINALAYTSDADCPYTDAVAVSGGRIAALGDEARAIIGADTCVIDAGGRPLFPAMVDAHQHLLYGFRGSMFGINLVPGMDHGQYLDEIANFIAAHPEDEIYTGAGFEPENYFGLGPHRRDLDDICPDKPVIILSYDGHTTWANTKALSLAGIDDDTPDPEYGVITRDADGHVTGYLAGAASACAGGLLNGFMPGYTRDQNKRAILAAQEEMLRAGVTGVYDAHVDEDEDYFMAYEELAREGKLKLIVRGAWFVPRDTGDEADINALIDRCIEKSKLMTTENFQVTGFKFLCDQVTEAHTAYMDQPYADRDDGWRGVCAWSDNDMLARIFARIDRAGFCIHVHQMGDGAARCLLDALEGAERINGKLNRIHTFAHCQFISERDKKRMARLGVNALLAPYWINSTIFCSMDVPFLGRARAVTQYPVKSLMDLGITVGCHSDYTVSHPDWCDAIYGFTARALSPNGYKRFLCCREQTYTTDPAVEPSARVCCPLPRCEERIGLYEAIDCITLHGAKTMGIDGVTGSITPGKRADLVIMSGDIRSMVAEHRCERPVLTVCGGEIGYCDIAI